MPPKRQMALYLSAVFCMAIAVGIQDSIFNNFLADTFHLSADARGWLEFPREFPGLMVVVMAGVLCMLPVTRVGMVGALGLCGGLVGLGLFGMEFIPMLGMMLLASAGMHLLQPVGASVILALSNENNRGRRMGLASAVGTVGVVIGTGSVWLFLDKERPVYPNAFFIAAVIAALGAFFYMLMNVPHLHQPRSRMVFKKEFRLYYALEFLFGARKQVFITFGPWVLIKVYGLPASSIAGLMMLAALIGIVFKPLAGIVIDWLGERFVMVGDGIALCLVCLGYGYAKHLTGDADTARIIACACFVFDDLLFALGNARSVYLSRLTSSHQELNASLAMGVSINHIASMSIPAVAGALWVGFGYERVFLAAAVFALFCAMVSTFVPGKKPAAAPFTA